MAAVTTPVDIVQIYATSNGTGAISLGSAVPGYRGVEALTNGAQYTYSIRQDANYELGVGTYLSAGHQLTRSPLYSSNGGSAINLQPNAEVGFVLSAEDFLVNSGNIAIVAADLALGSASKIALAMPSALLASNQAAIATAQAQLSAQYRSQTQTIQGQVNATAATAMSALLTASAIYATTMAGLAATPANGYFYVAASGDVFATLYQNSAGSAVPINTMVSQVGIKRLGAAVVVTPGTSVDNALAINAALNDPNVTNVLIPAGAVSIATAIIVPSGKWLRGAGRGVTVITRTNSNPDAGGIDPALLRSADGSSGGRVSDMTLIAPKSGNKVQGVHARATTDFLAERIDCYNMGYAFWAQGEGVEGSALQARYITFRDIRSYNANVHFETTQAYDVLFDNMISGDGDGDNPLGFEAVWHCLLASRRIKFNHGRHVGSGTAYEVIANDTNGDATGLIDDITFNDCRAINTDGKVGLQVDHYNNLPIGTVRLIDCGVTGNANASGVLGIVNVGNVRMRGGTWVSYSQENFIVQGGSLEADGVNVMVTSSDQAPGTVYSASPGVPIRIISGIYTLVSAAMELAGGDVANAIYVSQSTQIITPNAIYAPRGVGQSVSYLFPANLSSSSGYATVAAVFNAVSGKEYRVRMAGRMQKNGTNGQLAFYIDPASGVIASGYGPRQMQDASGVYQNTSDSVLIPANAGDVRAFNMDFTFAGAGNSVPINFGGGDGATILAGARITIDRLS